MNWDQINDNWEQASDKIKLTWGKLSEDDLSAISGQRDVLTSLLQQKYGYEQQDVESRVDRFAEGLSV